MTPPTGSNETLFALFLMFLTGYIGNFFGQLVLILSLSFLGALFALSRVKTVSFWPQGAIVLGKGMGLAVVVGGIGSAGWAHFFGSVPLIESLGGVSFLVGLKHEWVLAKIDMLTGGNR